MINYPISFYANAETHMGVEDAWQVEASDFKTSCSVPKEFEGGGEALSPEDYYLMALQNCFVATFKVYAKYSKLSFSQLQVKAELIVDKDQEAKPFMKTVKLDVKISEASDEKKAQLLYKKTLENGFILRSIKTEIMANLSMI